MGRAIFVVSIVDSNVVLPPMTADEGELQLRYTEGGEIKGGFSCIGPVPNGPTAIVRIETSAAAIAAMQADPSYQFVEEV